MQDDGACLMALSGNKVVCFQMVRFASGPQDEIVSVKNEDVPTEQLFNRIEVGEECRRWLEHYLHDVNVNE